MHPAIKQTFGHPGGGGMTEPRVPSVPQALQMQIQAKNGLLRVALMFCK